MARPPRLSGRRLPETLRSRLEVASALAWEALVDTHAQQAQAFVRLLEDRMPLEEALPRFLVEVDLGDAMAGAVRNRALVAIEDPDEDAEGPESPAAAADEQSGWARFRPSSVMREFRARQKRDDETEMRIKLALARAEEAAIATHVDNAITFAALLEGYLPFDRAIAEYLEAVGLIGSRAQAVHQRTMARLADVHLKGPHGRGG
jgi:hypothetical protein